MGAANKEAASSALEEALEAIRSQPTVKVPEACVALGISDWGGYAAIKRGDFPIPVIVIGKRIVIPTSPLRKLLQIDTDEEA
jgi:predicted DNA-binding transcriptional regulator AlpA